MLRVVVALLPALVLAAGCRQQVVVCDCEDATPAADAQPAPDAAVDAGVAEDAMPLDSGEMDAGAEDAEVVDTGACDPFCFEELIISNPVVDVGETVTISPRVDAQAGVNWVVTTDIGQLQTSRAPNRPALRMSDVRLDLGVGGRDVSFTVQDVAPWFFETTFTITVTVRDPNRGFEQSLTADVKVRGNVLFSSGTEGRIYAVSSDGRPATFGGFSNGTLIGQLAVTPRAMTLASDGTLLVVDHGTSPVRVSRYELTGADVSLAPLQFLDGQSDPIFRSGTSSELIYGIAQLPDGRTIVPEYQFAGVSGQPKSRIMVWRPDGTFERDVWAPTPDENWRSVAVSPTGEVLVADRELDIVSRYNATTWGPDGTFVDTLPETPYTLHSTPDALYVGGNGFIIEASWAGGRAAIGGLPGGAATWRALTAYEGGRLLAVRDTQSTTANIALIENRQFVRDFRVSGGPVTQIWGIVYLR